jgi:hypothetical protein
MAEEQQGGAGGVRKRFPVSGVQWPVLLFVVLVLGAVWLWRRDGAPESTQSSSPTPQRGSQTTLEARALNKAVQPMRGASPSDAGVTAQAAGAGRADAGDAQLAGQLIAMGQSLALGEALAKNAANADKYLDKLCGESAKLKAHPAMPDTAGVSADAAVFMAPRMDYEKPLDQPPGSLHLSDELRTKLRGADWLAKITDQDLTGRDFSWMAALAQYDHWSYLGAGRLRDAPEINALSGSIPNYSSLIGWTKLRYALAMRRGDAAQASAEVRHLADLIASQGLLISQMVAVVIYREDVPARAAAQTAGQEVSAWIAPDLDDLQKTRELSFAAMYFGYPGVEPENVRKAMSCSLTPCVSLAEAAAINKSIGTAAGGDNLQLLNQLAADRGCEPLLFARINGTHEMATPEALDVMSDDLPLDIPKHLDGL